MYVSCTALDKCLCIKGRSDLEHILLCNIRDHVHQMVLVSRSYIVVISMFTCPLELYEYPQTSKVRYTYFITSYNHVFEILVFCIYFTVRIFKKKRESNDPS